MDELSETICSGCKHPINESSIQTDKYNEDHDDYEHTFCVGCKKFITYYEADWIKCDEECNNSFCKICAKEIMCFACHKIVDVDKLFLCEHPKCLNKLCMKCDDSFHRTCICMIGPTQWNPFYDRRFCGCGDYDVQTCSFECQEQINLMGRSRTYPKGLSQKKIC